MKRRERVGRIAYNNNRNSRILFQLASLQRIYLFFTEVKYLWILEPLLLLTYFIYFFLLSTNGIFIQNNFLCRFSIEWKGILRLYEAILHCIISIFRSLVLFIVFLNGEGLVEEILKILFAILKSLVELVFMGKKIGI